MQIAVKTSFQIGGIFPAGQLDFGPRQETLVSKGYFFLKDKYIFVCLQLYCINSLWIMQD